MYFRPWLVQAPVYSGANIGCSYNVLYFPPNVHGGSIFIYYTDYDDDLITVRKELMPAIRKWKDISLALGLPPSKLANIERESKDACDCLTQCLTLWLKREYKTEKFGKPSWTLLARAVCDRAGGNDPALAEEITSRHGGISWVYLCYQHFCTSHKCSAYALQEY